MSSLNRDSYNKFFLQYIEGIENGFHHNYVEKPAMYSKSSSLNGKTVLCIGCGEGSEIKHILEMGAAKITGIDITENLLNEAKSKYPTVQFLLMDMDEMNFPDESFDLVYSSLAIHYTKDFPTLCKRIFSILKTGGVFLFSSTHPLMEIVEKYVSNDQEWKVIGKAKSLSGKPIKYFGNYFHEGPKEVDWGCDGFKLNFNHMTLETLINALVSSGLTLIEYSEPRPIKAAKEKFPDQWEEHNLYPLFAIFKCIKK